MAPNIFSDPSVRHWLENRKEAFQAMRQAGFRGEPERWLQARKAFPFYTSSNPHSCKHCNNIIIDLADDGSKSRVKLPYDLRESVLVARGGCALYQAFVDALFRSTTEEMRAGWTDDAGPSFWIDYSPEALPYQTAQMRFTILASSPEGTIPVLHTDGDLTVWTLEGDPAAVDVSTRPYELDYQSPASTAWGRSCIEYCQVNHPMCNDLVDRDQSKEIITLDSIPSRLLNLYRDKSNALHVRIVGRDMAQGIPTLEVSHKGFAVLSYCWGGPQPIQLTRNTNKLAPIYPAAVLPKTIADAAWFAHELGLEYLWVDALCILQDDPNDKGREIPRMGQYYGDATITLCAASAETCFEGFLPSPAPAEDAANYVTGPIALRVRTTRGEPGTVQAVREADYFNAHRVREPVVSRGWTLQESLLSRRLVIFSSHHLYFTCREANASCGGREPAPKPRVLGTYESRVPGITTVAALQRTYPTLSTWDKVVNEYSRRRLGFAADKLPAISAMAAALVRMARDDRAQDLRYCAGLMLAVSGDGDGNGNGDGAWRNELLWAVAEPAVPLPDRPSSPSWSWASLQAPVLRAQIVHNSTASDDEDDNGIRLLEVHAPLEDERNPFGSVRGGFIRLAARTRRLSTIDGAETKMLVTRVSNLEDDMYDGPSRSVLVLRPDAAETDGLIAHGGEGILLLELAPLTKKSRGSTYVAGLLLVSQGADPGEEGGYYRRVGMFEFKVKETVAGGRWEIGLVRARALFEDCALSEVCIL